VFSGETLQFCPRGTNCAIQRAVLAPAQDLTRAFALDYTMVHLRIQPLVTAEVGEERAFLQALVPDYVRYFVIRVRHSELIPRTPGIPNGLGIQKIVNLSITKFATRFAREVVVEIVGRWQ
jgi:hypothetical protein